MTIKMINQFGNKFECGQDEVATYVEANATFENKEEQAKYESTLPVEVKSEPKTKIEEKK